MFNWTLYKEDVQLIAQESEQCMTQSLWTSSIVYVQCSWGLLYLSKFSRTILVQKAYIGIDMFSEFEDSE